MYGKNQTTSFKQKNNNQHRWLTKLSEPSLPLLNYLRLIKLPFKLVEKKNLIEIKKVIVIFLNIFYLKNIKIVYFFFLFLILVYQKK
jgi:hypothetical protein